MKRARLVAMIFAAILAAATFLDGRVAAAEPSPSKEAAADPHGRTAPVAPQPNEVTDPVRLRCECVPLPVPVSYWSTRRLLGLKALGFAAIGGAVGIGLAWSARRETNQAQTSMAAASQNAQIHERIVVAGTLLGVAGVATIAGAALVLWPEGRSVSVTVLPNGGAFVACEGTI